MLSTIGLLAVTTLGGASFSTPEAPVCSTLEETEVTESRLADGIQAGDWSRLSASLAVNQSSRRSPSWCTERDSLADPFCAPEGQGQRPGPTPTSPQLRFDPLNETSSLESQIGVTSADPPPPFSVRLGLEFVFELDRPPRA